MKRPMFLTIWLILLVVLSLFSIFSDVIASMGVLPIKPLWSYYISIAFSLVTLGAVYMLWKWKKMGFYIMVGMAVVSFLVGFATGTVSPLAMALSIIFMAAGIGILYLAMRPVWKNFK